MSIIPICDDCFAKTWPDRVPVRLVKEERQEETCDMCEAKTLSGIYGIRDPRAPKLKVGPDIKIAKGSACLSCGYVLDAATNVGKTGAEKPDPGSISMCLNCGHIAAFADDMSLRELTSEEMRWVAGNETILRMQKARAEAMKKGNEP